MKKLFKISTLLLATVLLLTFIPTTLAAGHPFTDVLSGSWYEPYVDYVYQNQLMSGTSDITFAPNASMSRAMAVTVLYRMAGTPAVSSNNPFKDVPAGTWYTDAVLWANENGITSGTSSTTFSPNTNVNREQLVTFLYRYAQTLDLKLDFGSLLAFSDTRDMSDFARRPFHWAVSASIISGTDENHLSPKGSATRAQCAAILTRFDLWVKNDAKKAPAPGEDGYIDPRIQIWETPVGKTVYDYGSVSVIDGRTWGDPPSIYITDEDGFDITYYKQDGAKVEFTLTPFDGYSLMCAIYDDGSYKTSLVGDFND